MSLTVSQEPPVAESRPDYAASPTDQTLPPLLLEKITSSSKGIHDDQIKYISHRM
jgi:hypothetical protein